MKRDTKVALLYFTTILSILNLYLKYYQVYRYISLYFSDLDKYFEKYKDLKRLVEENVVLIIDFNTSTKKQIDLLLKSILDQTFAVTDIYFINKNMNEEQLSYYKEKGIKILSGDKNIYYDAVIKACKKVTDCNTVVVALDESIIYGKDFIEILLRENSKKPLTLLQNKNGVLFKPDFFKTSIVDSNKDINIVDYLNDNIEIENINYNENYPILNF